MIYTANLIDLQLTSMNQYFLSLVDYPNPELLFSSLSRSQQLDCIDFLAANDFFELAEKLNKSLT